MMKGLLAKYAPDIAGWSQEQREYLIYALEGVQNNRHDVLNDLYEADYITKPAPIEEFLMNPDLLGLVTKIRDWDDDDPESRQDLYPFWKHELADLFAPEKNYQQWVISAGIGAGKSFCSVIAILYKVYRLLCMRNPQDFCGLAQGTPIVFGFFSATKVLSNVTEHRILTGIMETSPFFKRMVGATDTVKPHELLRLPHNNIMFAFGSRATHALGQNLIGGLMDEAAFGILTEQRQMTELFDGIWRRLVSRYSNSPSPGLLILASSKSSQTDFLERHIQRWVTVENAGLVKLTRGALYDIKPHQFPAKDKFKIMIGNEVTPSRILEDGELPNPGFAIEEVPDHPALRSQFNADLEGALRDISAICVTNESPLIPLREKISACIDDTRQHPFKTLTVYAGTRDEMQVEHSFNHEQVLVRKISGWVPRINPGFSRYIHIDIGLTHDALGLAVVHLAGNQQAQTLNELGEPVTEDLPIICVDLLLQVKCRQGDQIDLNKITKFVMYLSRFCGYPIGGISFDQFQSAHISQILAKLNFPVSYVSVDRTETPYLTLASLIQNESVSYYEYPILLKELRELRRDLEKRKIDHPARSGDGTQGSKDCADALAGAVAAALKDKHSYAQGDLMPVTDRDLILRGDANRKDPSDMSWVAGVNGAKVRLPSATYPRDVFGNPAVKP